MVEHDKRVNLEKIVGFIEEAAEEEASLLVFPECSLQGYLWTWNWEKNAFREDEDQKQYFYEVAEPIPGRSTETVTRLAGRHNMLIQLGMVEKVSNGVETALYNSAALIGPEGVVGVFRKVHDPTERIVFHGGRELPVFDTFVGKIGPIICSDLLFPETVRVLSLKGADIITMSTAWEIADYSAQWYDVLGRANAIMNWVWIVMADQVGTPKRMEHGNFGHSRIIDPSGEIVAGIGYEEGLVSAKVDIRGTKPLETLGYADRFFGRCPESYKIISSEV